MLQMPGMALSIPTCQIIRGSLHISKECGQIVASKFFPVKDEDSNGNGQYPLCEADYFRRLDLLCYDCGRPLRGSFIAALDRKYHIEHFACNVCRLPFGAQDSYYEHEGQPYCHYHYYALAQICQGCTGGIFKQYVEIFRNGQNQIWHPECYMIHKFWNVRLGSEFLLEIDLSILSDNPTEEQRERLQQIHDKLEERVYLIWTVVSKFEESCAGFISDMLLHVSNGAYSLAFSQAHKFLGRVGTIFGCLEGIHRLMTTNNVKGMPPTVQTNADQAYQHQLGVSYMREAKLLCKKIVALFTLISRAQKAGVGVRKLGVITGLAHYLKLLVQKCLQATFRLEGQKPATEALTQFLDWIDAESPGPDLLTNPETISRLARNNSDCCASCQKPIEEACIRCEDESWHKECLRCSECAMNLCDQLEDVFRNSMLQKVICSDSMLQKVICIDCMAPFPFNADYYPHKSKFVLVAELDQYVFLLSVAMARLMVIFQAAGITISGETESLPSDASVDPPLRPGQSSNQQSIEKSHVASHDENDGDKSPKTISVSSWTLVLS
jgi:hypothetical protein